MAWDCWKHKLWRVKGWPRGHAGMPPEQLCPAISWCRWWAAFDELAKLLHWGISARELWKMEILEAIQWLVDVAKVADQNLLCSLHYPLSKLSSFSFVYKYVNTVYISFIQVTILNEECLILALLVYMLKQFLWI